jgi:hypothetical protein
MIVLPPYLRLTECYGLVDGFFARLLLASLFDGLVRGLIDDPYFVEILERDLAEGQHRNPRNVPDYFTTAFFHHPFELAAEIREAGFSILELAAVEGPAWLAKDFAGRWADPGRRAQILKLVRMVEHETAIMEVSPHIMIIGNK